MGMKKIYVMCGDIQTVIIASGPLDACKRVLLRQSDTARVLDTEFFYLDERGFREGDKAQYKVPVEQALAEAGYVFEPSEDTSGEGFLPPTGWSPSAEE